jgi:tetratricopeptide (TPR) repeat protein
MNSVSGDHDRAMELVDRALEARRQGDTEKATACFREAFAYERRAAERVAPDTMAEPTRSVVHRSAAALALECGELREAERLIAIALSGDPPDEIAEELRNLWQQVYRDLRKVPLASAG